MTTWKTTDPAEVTRVYRALVAAFLREEELPEKWGYDITLIPRPRKRGKARALWEAMRLAYAAWARFERRTTAAQHAARGEALAVLDDDRRDHAIASVERALSSLQNAEESLQADVDALIAAGRSIAKVDTDEQKGRVKRMRDLIERVSAELTSLKTFKGIRQIWTRREWDTFISESADALLEVDCSSREVAGLLTGTPEDEIDRATLERFRQRVRRRNVSAS